MSFLSKTQLRKLVTISLIFLSVFFGFTLGIGHSDRVLAEVLKRDAVGITEEGSLSEAEYESAKANRNQIQAERSKQAAEDLDNKKAADKLNLEEIVVPPVIEKALDLDD
ncbi:MAG: hypothetical protein KME09_03575 [Pleurocapsa minor HA4230-MV1]|jgi:hypothetical protein|nr:hypothetical protein [Pleurocapsa minor HA4230-MV1]